MDAGHAIAQVHTAHTHHTTPVPAQTRRHANPALLRARGTFMFDDPTCRYASSCADQHSRPWCRKLACAGSMPCSTQKLREEGREVGEIREVREVQRCAGGKG
mgnify:CR=1 FL=1